LAAQLSVELLDRPTGDVESTFVNADVSALEAILEALRAIPEGIWGVIIGSVLAFTGTFAATWLQLRHDAAQRELDRKMQLRKEVFLEAAEGVASTDYFMNLANTEIPVNEITAPSGKSGWLNKLQTVASAEAIEAFYDANAAVSAAVFDLFHRRIAIDQIKNTIDSTNQSVETIKTLQQRIREATAAAAQDAPTPEVLQQLQAMQRDWDQSWVEIDRLGQEVSTLFDKRFRQQLELLETAVQYSLGYQKKLRKALVTLRAELVLPIDHAKLETALDRIDADMLPKFQRLLDMMKADIPEQPQGNAAKAPSTAQDVEAVDVSGYPRVANDATQDQRGENVPTSDPAV
jgi:hypothetical protein